MSLTTFPSLHPLLYPQTNHHRPSSLTTAAIHARALRLNLLSGDPSLSSQLLQLYSSSGHLSSARSLLLQLHSLTLRDFNVLISSHSSAGLPQHALQLFDTMLRRFDFTPNEFTIPHVLRSASLLGLLHLARQIHAFLVKKMVFGSNVYCATALLDVYAKWASLSEACNLFDRMPQSNVVAWNTMLSAFAQNGLVLEAIEMLRSMEESGVVVGISSWNSVIAGCVRLDDAELSLEVFVEMVNSGTVIPSTATFNTLLPVIPRLPSLEAVREFHGLVLRCLLVAQIDSIDEDRLWTAIAGGYAFHGCLSEATRLFERVNFKTTQLWVAVISGFLDSGRKDEAFDLFREMASELGEEARPVSKVLLTLLLPVCSSETKHGVEIHAYAYRRELEASTSVGNALMAMYAKRGDMESCLKVFERAPEKDVISWNTLLSSVALTDDFAFAFQLFQRMLAEGVRPDEFSFSAILNGCGNSSHLQQAMAMHGLMIKSGFAQFFMVVQNALMDTYGKCGCIEEARQVFDEMDEMDSISWNTIISCYCFSDHPQQAFVLFDKMRDKGWKPNRVTFISLLSACSHAGLLDEGLHFFEMMSRDYAIIPDLDHYACIVDNFGRAGQLNRAYQFIKDMPIEPDDCIWSALLSACRIHGNIELAEIAANKLIELDPQHSGYWVLLSNIYAGASRWADVAQVRAAMKDSGVKKSPGYSWIEVSGSEVHKFVTSDKSHKQSAEIYVVLNGLTEQLKDEGYVPQRDCRLASSNVKH